MKENKRDVWNETNSAGKNCKRENILLGMVVIWFESPRDDATPGSFFVSYNFRLQKDSNIRQRKEVSAG